MFGCFLNCMMKVKMIIFNRCFHYTGVADASFLSMIKGKVFIKQKQNDSASFCCFSIINTFTFHKHSFFCHAEERSICYASSL